MYKRHVLAYLDDDGIRWWNILEAMTAFWLTSLLPSFPNHVYYILLAGMLTATPPNALFFYWILNLSRHFIMNIFKTKWWWTWGISGSLTSLGVMFKQLFFFFFESPSYLIHMAPASFSGALYCKTYRRSSVMGDCTFSRLTGCRGLPLRPGCACEAVLCKKIKNKKNKTLIRALRHLRLEGK